MNNIHSANINAVIEKFKTDIEKGLTSHQAKFNLDQFGENRLEATAQRTLLNMLLDQFKDFTVIILIIASFISIALGETIDGGVIIGIVILNAILGTYQENKASNALDALKSMASPKAKVIRDQSTQEIDSSLLVPGDIVLLESGDYVPADLRLIESINLKIDESALTGESVPVEKNAHASIPEKSPIGDRVNCAYSGTIVTYGRGKAIVVNTGMQTEIGHIATMLNEASDDLTPLQQKLSDFGKLLGIICIVVSIVIMGLGILRNENLLDIFMTAVSLAVAAIPEGLPAVVTTVLALGMQRMVKKNAIMKRLSAVETLGSTTTICSDKTGTLTQNKMTVQSIYANQNEYKVSGTGYTFEGTIEGNTENLRMLLLTATLCNDALIKDADCIGDPTEGALVVLAEKAHFGHISLRKNMPRISEYPFDSVRKLMTTVHQIDDQLMMLTKGAPDELIKRCSDILIEGKKKSFTPALKTEYLDQNTHYAKQALRVIAYAYKPLSPSYSIEQEEQDMIFLGLTGMIDPPRSEAIEAIATCKRAGINVVMITGDHITTASAIGNKLGILDQNHSAIEGAEIDSLDDAALLALVKDVNVYARVSPEHKVKIVNAIQNAGHIVAMTGDGVNDAPALKNADIGIAMGITGTDVSKEAADMILTDDNFASIVSAVEEGRIIYSNIRKFVGFLLSCNVGEILIIFIAMLLNWGVPLVPIQLLWVNLITDSFPAFALGVERGEKGIMNKPPRDKKEPIVDTKMGIAIVFQSIGLTFAVLLAFKIGGFIALHSGAVDPLSLARTFAFMTLIFGEMLRAYSARREDQYLWQFNPFGNKYLNLSVLVAVVLLFMVVYIPFLQTIFKTTSIHIQYLLMIIGLSFIPTLFGEFSKFIIKRMK
ncbi:calcium-translocating P-type ATPase, SERCA-type [Fusibacter ferrireducens]|uniref:P-type Ca(2+) transporter n=1 Tax=Fusibacter ferrireducens TaxID=2785058 RepID=A0ABR9ZN85_9FIRM|nr:calcium-translocating P-type ATPase, SERCA-type [Fusibacter ferrireducens]MBF4691925.1 calcium-translocating P-type ATPase, SERCA-type [Fusibacter ferrireducens]